MHVYSPIRVASQYWWLMLIWGILVALFGLCAIFWPHLTLLMLIFLFGAFALVNGVLGIVMAIQERHELPSWWVALVAGIISLIIGIAVMFWPHATAIVILYFIASWAIITGVFQLAEAISGMSRLSPWILAITGIASLLLGIILFASSPLVALLTLVWLIGIYALIYGGMLIARSFYFRSLLKSVPPQYREPEFLP
jgi:uncharacterized membrane protein HdeD (DUF308 family)